MNTQSERLANHLPLSRERRRARTLRAHFHKHPPASTGNETKSYFRKKLCALIESSLSMWVLVAILAWVLT
jgi:hypothetical protein